MVLITPHRVFELIKHVFTLLIATKACSCPNRVLSASQVKLRCLTFLNTLGAFELLRRRSVLILFYFHHITSGVIGRRGANIRKILFFWDLSRRAQTLFKAFQQTSILVKLFSASTVVFILLIVRRDLTKIYTALENHLLIIKWRHFIFTNLMKVSFRHDTIF